jgi:hypothetical protein
VLRETQREEERDLTALLNESDDGEEAASDGSDEATPSAPARKEAGRTGGRSRLVQVRCTLEQYADLERRARAAGASDLSAYLRPLIVTEQKAPTTPEPAESAGHERSRRVYVHLNAQEWATLEERRARLGMAELGAYVRRAALACRPLPYVPEVNRQGWVELIGHLETLDELARHLRGLLRPPARAGLGGLFGRSGLEERLERVSTELGAVHEAIQALRRDLLGTK